MERVFEGIVCKGCYAIDTHCGTCERCLYYRRLRESRISENDLREFKRPIPRSKRSIPRVTGYGTIWNGPDWAHPGKKAA